MVASAGRGSEGGRSFFSLIFLERIFCKIALMTRHENSHCVREECGSD